MGGLCGEDTACSNVRQLGLLATADYQRCTFSHNKNVKMRIRSNHQLIRIAFVRDQCWLKHKNPTQLILPPAPIYANAHQSEMRIAMSWTDLICKPTNDYLVYWNGCFAIYFDRLGKFLFVFCVFFCVCGIISIKFDFSSCRIVR